jgi:hypothetical protein
MAAAAAALAAHRSHKCARATAGEAYCTVYYGDGLYNEPRRAAERAAHLALVRCVFGNPFRPATADSAWQGWNDGTIRKLAQAIYDERRFGDLPILADALEDAGCTDADILSHCRQPGPHARGCWPVDLILGKK